MESSLGYLSLRGQGYEIASYLGGVRDGSAGGGGGAGGLGGGVASPPRDRFNGIYFGLILAGIGFLLPYNSFIIAVDYFQDKYPGTTIVFDMSTIYIFSALGAVLLNNMLVDLLSLNTRITFGYVISFLSLSFVAIFEVWLEAIPKVYGYHVVLMSIVLLAFGCTVQQSSFYGYTSMLPRRYTQAVMAGESAAGFIVSINRILTKDFIEDLRTNTLFFFVISITIVFFCYVVHKLVEKSSFVLHYIGICRSNKNAFNLETSPHYTPHVNEQDGPSAPAAASRHQPQSTAQPEGGGEPIDEDITLPQFGESCNLSPDVTRQINDVFIGFGGKVKSIEISSVWLSIKNGLRQRWYISRRIWPFMLAIGLDYFVTLCLFPGIESEIVSCRLGSWMPVLIMAAFNLFDLFGKVISSFSYSCSGPELVVMSLARILLIPFMVMCAAPRIRPIISSEVWAFLLSALLGVTNGVFGSVPMIVAPAKVEEAQRELAGNIMTLSYSIGLALGSCTSYLLDHILGEPLADNCPRLPMTGSALNATGMTYLESQKAEHYHNIPAQNISIPL